MEAITISREEYRRLKQKADLDEDLLMSLVKGLEDIKAGRIKPWKTTLNGFFS
ncbi:MAG TPA: hypothetical protein VJI32_07580 [Candidatus Nanoarchaeia archaeon]|nr:hypothetical protein [Candidatus Nanoarchaeia archaeon]